MKSLFIALLIGASAAPVGRDQAEAYCESHSLAPIEGIWEYPDDGVTVLISRDEGGKAFDPYILTVVDSESPDLAPGDRLGEITPTPAPDKFRLVLFTRRKGDLLADPRKCAARLCDDGYGLQVECRKVSFSFRPLALIPRFWRIATMRVDDPAAKLPAGMIKVFPSYDGNGSSRHKPRLL